ncbi:MAG TPA: DVUA0089 family protein [Vicinamibacterales bacterium]|nr:DVUA0089 family protein [Vicinamibacterales bacterium]
MRQALLLSIVLGLLAGPASAAPIVLSGSLDDTGNTALFWSDLGAPRFVDGFDLANNIAVYSFSLAVDSTVTFESFGWGLGGVEPYFSVFDGSGNAATFLDSNGISDPFNIDFLFSRSMAAGDYMLAIGSWMNMSFAENNPDADPMLGDGFTMLGVPSAGTYYYDVHVTCEPDTPTTAVPCSAAGGDVTATTTTGTAPEPGSLALMALGLGVAAAKTLRRRA